MLTTYTAQAESILWYNKNTNIREVAFMLFRCMMIIFLLMMSVIPGWANKKDAPPFDLPIEFQSAWECVQSGTIPPMEPFPTKFLNHSSEKQQTDSP